MWFSSVAKFYRLTNVCKILRVCGVISSLFFNQSLPKLDFRKIPKISPGAYIFQRPFLGGLILEGLIFGGAYLLREICVSQSIGLACSEKEIYHFCFVLLCIRGQIPSTRPPGAYIRRGDLTEGFLRSIIWPISEVVKTVEWSIVKLKRAIRNGKPKTVDKGLAL